MTPQTLATWVAEHADEVRAWSPVATDTDPKDCLVEACNRPAWRVGLCKAHAWRAHRIHRALTRDEGLGQPARGCNNTN